MEFLPDKGLKKEDLITILERLHARGGTRMALHSSMTAGLAQVDVEIIWIIRAIRNDYFIDEKGILEGTGQLFQTD